MTRRVALCLLLLALPGLASSQEKKKKQKPSFLGVMVSAGKENGTLLVMTVFPDGPADKAGLLPGDVILKIAGAAPPDLATGVEVIRALKAGRKATLLVSRKNKAIEIDVVPRERE